ncbi:type III secretion system inner membrane ring lipoprotein SctJ [Bradyrhizobium neotropicale]|uniref:type III secretion system inner membrane ring lipoprotein SctJ n=1 Tax=Bradyrhizobium neotropicale TaxID=1497615 RepID=UPI001AD60999|nr:type III secretion inner membrane ring lipoprotein SctJ [Bradyrhizobium neotropicale]MBO4227533.1 EscJ/YscJ/HrcJ family type III secretion inner membrane ring protein [Bradyrhizobium neotropicale]
MTVVAQRKIGRGAPAARRFHVFVLLPLLLSLAGCKADLYTKVQEREANEMLALLLGRGVDAARVVAKDGTSTIQVEEKQLAFSIDLLNEQGLPRQAFKNLGEVFKGSGLVASPVEERARYVYALSEELSRTINDIDGVLSARVHVVLPKNDLLRQDATPSSASVFIRHGSNAKLSALLPQIKMLVANSIEGLSYDKVAVVFVPVERGQHEMSSPPAAASAQPTKFTSTLFLAVGIGAAGAAFCVLCYVLLSTRARQLGQFWRKVALARGASMPGVQAARKKMASDAR